MRLVWLGLVLMLAACSERQVYQSSQGWRQNECGKIVDVEKNEACLRDANKPYTDYQKDREAVQQGH